MAKVTKKEQPKIQVKKNIKKAENNKVSIFPTLGIILAHITANIFHYIDTANILKSTMEDKELLSITLDAMQIVSFNFIICNVVLLFLELLLYWKKKYKALYVVVGAIVVLTISSGAINFACVTLVPLAAGIYYVVLSLKKES